MILAKYSVISFSGKFWRWGFAPGLKAITWHSHSTRTVLVRRCRNVRDGLRRCILLPQLVGFATAQFQLLERKPHSCWNSLPAWRIFFYITLLKIMAQIKGYNICIFPLPSGAPVLLEGRADLFTVLGIWQLWQQVFVEWMPLLLSKSCKWGITGSGHPFILITGAGHPFILLITH